MGFLSELKRRNVIRMAGLYLVGAWLITQVAATLLPVFEAPAWVMKAVVVVLGIGFFAALVFAWVFELTPEGLKRDSDVPAAQSIAPQTARRLDRMIILVLALALGFFAVDKFVFSSGHGDAPSRAANDRKVQVDAATVASAGQASIAVLPFVNMSTDVENGFFADGISEELLNVLSGVEGLKVASRTSAFSFKGKDTPIPEIARQLGVEHVLEGSVRKQGQRVRITAQLIKAGTDTHLWSETYDRDLTDIFKVQEEIARSITHQLEGVLGKRDVAVAITTTNMQAYQNFLRGRARFHRRRELPAAIDDLSRAVEQDPNFADAWVYLAAAWWVAPGYDSKFRTALAHSKAQAREALRHALDAAPEHPVGLSIQGMMRAEDEGDFLSALEALEKAGKTSVEDSTPQVWRGQLLLRAGYVGDAIEVFEAVRANDPLSGVNEGYLAIAYLSAGRQAEAEAAARKGTALGWPIGMQVLVYDLAGRGQRARAVALWDEVVLPELTEPEAARNALKRALLSDPTDAKALAALLADSRAEEGTLDFEHLIATQRPDLLLDFSQDMKKQMSQLWWLRSTWLPSTRKLREDPRYFALAESLGLVRLWQQRGYPVGCKLAKSNGGDHLDCEVPQS